MSGLMLQIGVNVIVAVVVAGVSWFGARFLAPLGRVQLFGVPRIAGRYIASYPDDPAMDSEIVTVTQVGSAIRARAASARATWTLRGYVTPTRLLHYLYKPKGSEMNSFGGALLKFDKQLQTARGYVLVVAEADEKPTPLRVELQRESALAASAAMTRRAPELTRG